MICKYCNNPTPDGEFCIHCGAKAKPSEEFGTRNGLKLWIIILSIILTFLIAGCFIAWHFMSDKNAPIPLDEQIELGYNLIDEGEYEDAILEFDKAIKIDSKNFKAYAGKAVAMAHGNYAPTSIIAVINEGCQNSEEWIIEANALNPIIDILQKNQKALEANFFKNLISQYTPGFSGDIESPSALEVSPMCIKGNWLVTLQNDGIYLKSLFSGSQQKVIDGDEITSFVFDGANIYYYDMSTLNLVRYNIYTLSSEIVVNITAEYDRLEVEHAEIYDIEHEFFRYGEGYISTAYKNRIYFDISYAAGGTNTYVFNLDTKQYQMMREGGAFIKGFKDDNVYFVGQKSVESSDDPFLSSDLDGKSEKVLLENVGWYCYFVGDVLHYTYRNHIDNGDGTYDMEDIDMKYNIVTGEYEQDYATHTTTFGTLTYDPYAYGETQEIILTHTDGTTETYNGNIPVRGIDFVIISNGNKYTYISEYEKKEFVADNVSEIIGVYDGCMYYYDSYDPTRELKCVEEE